VSDTSGEDWLAMRLADVGQAWKEDVARLTSRIAELERAAETSRAEHAAAVKRAEAAEAWRPRAPALCPRCARPRYMAGHFIKSIGDDEYFVCEDEATLSYVVLERLDWREPSEHAAALGLATDRIRELEGERDELLGLLNLVPQYVRDVTPAVTRLTRLTDDIGAIVARIEKAAKGTR
jgi:hypothetical protein